MMTNKRTSVRYAFTFLAVVGLCLSCAPAEAPSLRVDVWIDEKLQDEPMTGRVFLLVSDDMEEEPRQIFPGTYIYYFNSPGMPYPALFGKDVEALKPGKQVSFDEDTLGYPFSGLHQLPAGDYQVQAILHVYTRFHRADGHTLWAPMDQWEGQQFHRSPGNLYSEPQSVHVEPRKQLRIRLPLTKVIPAIEPEQDTKWVKHIKIKSDLVSEFWRHDMFLGATVVLPLGYDKYPDARYPMVIHQGHFTESIPYGFPLDPEAALPTDALPWQRSRHERGSLAA